MRFMMRCLSEQGKKHRLKKELREPRSFLSGILPTDKLEPVITIVLYFGEEEWTAPGIFSDRLKAGIGLFAES